MTITEIKDNLKLDVICGHEHLQRQVSGAYVSDLLSDVMGNADEGEAWITLQSHLNVIAIASLKELACVIFVKGILPSDEVVKKAEEEDVVLLVSQEQTFALAGKLYNLLNQQ